MVKIGLHLRKISQN